MAKSSPALVAWLFLWLSPAIITVACIAAGVHLNAERAVHGPHKPVFPIVLLSIVLWLLHAGYLLGPWLWSNGRYSLALWSMIPVAVLVLGIAGLLSTRTLGATNGGTPLFWSMAGAALIAYLGPIVVIGAAVYGPGAAGAAEGHVRTVPYVIGAASIVIGVGSVLMMLVLLMASGANSSAAQIAQLKSCMLTISVVGLVGGAAATWLLIGGRPWIGAAVGSVPTMTCAAMLYWMMFHPSS